ncbi:EUKARYOTIC TRANSLATION INITIATION FACTOR 4B/4H [Salix purpurea]|uniref:EUKARYOTIC TRANSLATION INITIATION FACTOR 4B/4H n=1 Tax=Salix purpurea TaxID=77065 RepID=A0A9Q0T9G6_SALPP|nr:EUKARYOTIC TRANSLATION INITIATION FACTOR 4B/4H [Salix purpurea]
MGRRKHQEPDAASTQNNIVPASSYSFKFLFSGADQTAATFSLFSDSNPFKRKPDDPISNESPGANADIQDPDFNGTAVKPKKVNAQNPNLGLEPKEEKTLSESGRMRKKRKRDDLESEYEAKKYGSVVNDEENVGVVVGAKRKRADGEADVLVSKESEGFDDENKLLRTVFVGNLPLKVKKKALIKEFSTFGEVQSVRIRSMPITESKIPRKGAILLKKFNDNADSVHAYIVFNTEQSAEASLTHDMAMVGGNHIRVDRACPPRKKLKGAADTPLYDNKRTVFVGNLPYDVKEAANLVIKKRNTKLPDRELRASHARQESTPSKRRNSFAGDTANMSNKKLATDSRTPDRNNRPDTKVSRSYQGLRASKSGIEKKVHAPAHAKRHGTAMVKSKTRGEKRPGRRQAVALRKEKVTALKNGGASGPARQKRKLDSRTPDSSIRKKKARMFR